MVKYLYQNCGSSWAIGIEGDTEEEIKQHFYGFWNFGATKTQDIRWLEEGKLGFFWTTEKKLLNCLRNMAEMGLSREMNLEIDDIMRDSVASKIRCYYEKLIAKDVARRRANFQPSRI